MKQFIVIWLIIIASLSYALDGHAQRFDNKVKFRRLAENNQLSNLNITSIGQDQKGFLWIGTEDGLNRFDGYDIKTYRNIENDSMSLAKNKIESIYVDSRGTLWVASFSFGLHYYDRAKDAFCRVPAFSKPNYLVFSIIEDFDHNIWIGGVIKSHAFVAKLDHQSNQWQQFSLFQSNEIIHSMLQLNENELMLGTQYKGLVKWNFKTNELDYFSQDPSNPISLKGKFVKEIVKDQNGFLWTATNDGVIKYDIENKTFKGFQVQSVGLNTNIPSNVVRDICLDERYLWVGTENGGLTRIDTESDNLKNYFYNKADPNSIVNNSIWKLFKDHQGRIWIGSYSKGLCVLDVLDEKISTLSVPLENDLINAILKDSKDRLWIGTEDGLVLMEKTTIQRFRHDPKDTKSLGNNAVLCIYEDHKGQVWVGAWNGGLNRFVEDSKTFIRHNYDPKRNESLSNSNVFSITISSQTDELVIATFDGLNILKDERLGFFDHPFEYQVTGDQLQLAVFEDSKKSIWVGAIGGLSKHSLSNKTVEKFNILNDTSMASEQVNCIYEDHSGVLWVGSNAGLHKMVSPGQFVIYTIKDGLPANMIKGILEDAKGNLWLSTYKGLAVFDPKTGVFKGYDVSDGLLSNELRRNTFFKDKNGQIYVGGTGINTFYPDSIINNPTVPSVQITDLKVFNQSTNANDEQGILKQDIIETKEIYLNHTHSFFSIHYVGIQFTDSYKNQYAYKLEGFHEDWLNVGTLRSATFTNLDPGDYTFRVKASNNDGVWNEEGTSLIIHILPPWWKTWWAKLIFICFCLILVYSIIRIRTSYLNKQRNLLKIMVQNRTAELKIKNEQIAMQAEELQAFNDSLNALNENLEQTVEDRTNELMIKNQKLAEYAFINAHNMRVPVANIKGLLQLFEGNKSNKETAELIELLKGQSQNLDIVLIDIQKMLEKDHSMSVKENTL